MEKGNKSTIGEPSRAKRVTGLLPYLPVVPLTGLARQSGADWLLSLLYGLAGTLVVRFLYALLHCVGIRFIYLVEGERRSQNQRRLGLMRLARLSRPILGKSRGERVSDRVLCYQVAFGGLAVVILFNNVAVPSS